MTLSGVNTTVRRRIFHDFRRSAAHEAWKAGSSGDDCMKITGHKTSSMFKRYADLFSDEEKRTQQRAASDSCNAGFIWKPCPLAPKMSALISRSREMAASTARISKSEVWPRCDDALSRLDGSCLGPSPFHTRCCFYRPARPPLRRVLSVIDYNSY